MIRHRFVVLVLTVVLAESSFAQRIATLEVELTNPISGLTVPVSVNMEGMVVPPDITLDLVLVEGDRRTPVPFQMVNFPPRRALLWQVQTKSDVQTYVYEFHRGRSTHIEPMQATQEDGLLTIHVGDQNLLGYHYGMMYPPEGVDPAYKRSGFIHPLWSPHGQVLTRIQPPDHYHHYGLWNPWTRVLFEGDTVDFWNLGEGQGTVRHAGFKSIKKGTVFCEYQAQHEHVVLKKDGTEKVALNELQTVRVYRPGERAYIVDFTFNMNCATESPFRILAYRYAGFGWRATEQWNKDNSEILTSEGKTRVDADNTTARWCIVQGEVDNDYAGAVMMSNPQNYTHPEPLRIWPENMNERGDVYANFFPTRNKDWLLEPKQTYTLKYRFMVFNGHCTAKEAENAWQYYTKPPIVKVTLD